jgi:hypothetical protein
VSRNAETPAAHGFGRPVRLGAFGRTSGAIDVAMNPDGDALVVRACFERTPPFVIGEWR